MKNLFFTLLLLLAFKGWGQSPAINFSTSSSVLRPIFDLKQDNPKWQKQPASFSMGIDYLVPFGKKDFISIGIQYRQWQYNSRRYWPGYYIQPHIEPYLGTNDQLTTFKEFAIPIQFWLFSKKKPWQIFSRIGFTPSYVSNASVQKTLFRNIQFEFLNRDQFESWNYSADLALGLQWNFFNRMHTYLAVNSQLYLRKNQLYMRNGYDTKPANSYYDPSLSVKPFHKAGIGLELGVQYSL